MNKINHQHTKSSAEREAKYLPYKSYHGNRVRNSKNSFQEEQKLSSTSSELAKVRKSSKRITAVCERPTTIARQPSGYKGDNVNNARSESEKLQITMNFVALEGELASLRQAKCKLDEEIAQHRARRDSLQNENANLRQTIASVELQNEELRDQYELNSDQIKELLRLNDEKAELARKHECECIAAVARLKEVQRTNEELLQVIGELQAVNEEKDRAVDQLTGFKRKWESYKSKLDRALIEKQELADRIANDMKSVAALEANMGALQRRNQELEHRNEQLLRCVKNVEMGRQKNEELMKKQSRASSKESTKASGFNSYDSFEAKNSSNNASKELPASLTSTSSRKSSKKSSSCNRSYESESVTSKNRK